MCLNHYKKTKCYFTQFIVPKEFIHTGHRKQCKHNNLFIMHMLKIASTLCICNENIPLVKVNNGIEWLDSFKPCC